MDRSHLASLLEHVRDGEVDVGAAVDRLRDLPYEEVGGFACIDHHRGVRQGMPEVVLAEGKTSEQVVAIVERLADAREGGLPEDVQGDAEDHQRPDREAHVGRDQERVAGGERRACQCGEGHRPRGRRR